MEEIDFRTSELSAAAPLTKSTTEIAKIMTNELIKIYELNECCNLIESDLKKWYQTIEILTSAKKEGFKIKAEYKNKNKINAINSESLLQALNELYKYKSELKSSYIATEKAGKTKKIKYKKILSSYESTWQKALKEYIADPFFIELNNIQQENALIEEEIQRQEKLKQSAETELSELRKNLTNKFRENAIEFSKAMLQYKRFANSSEGDRKLESKNCEGIHQFKLFTAIEQTPNSFHNSEETNNSCGIDVSVFDDIMIPLENLESQNLEEDMTLADASKEEAETSEYLNNHSEKMSLKPQKEIVDDNESQYFRQQPLESPKQGSVDNLQLVEQWSTEKLDKHVDNYGERSKPTKNAGELQQVENGEEATKDLQMECDGSYEKQTDNHRDDSQYLKTSSLSSEDLPPSGENFNESAEPQNKLCNQSLKNETEKTEFKAFTGFFMMGNDQETSKPSIFKLF